MAKNIIEAESIFTKTEFSDTPTAKKIAEALPFDGFVNVFRYEAFL